MSQYSQRTHVDTENDIIPEDCACARKEALAEVLMSERQVFFSRLSYCALSRLRAVSLCLARLLAHVWAGAYRCAWPTHL